MLWGGDFQLQKWASNCPSALDKAFQEGIRTMDGINLDRDPSVKYLGLTWFPHGHSRISIFRSYFGHRYSPYQTNHIVSDCNPLRSSGALGSRYHYGEGVYVTAMDQDHTQK